LDRDVEAVTRKIGRLTEKIDRGMDLVGNWSYGVVTLRNRDALLIMGRDLETMRDVLEHTEPTLDY
jgi:hypothetical protein